MEIFSNPWLIGIGGGILSGIVVTLITRYLFSRRENREYTQKIVTANQEILYAIRPGISEGVIPSQDVLGSLITATAAKYTVDASDLHDFTAFADVLIKEVMDSSFLPASAKAEFCQKVAKLKPAPQPEEIPIETTIAATRSLTRIADYRRRMMTMMSGMLGIMAALMTGTFVFFRLLGRPGIEVRSKNLIILLPTVLTILVAFVATYSMWMYSFLKRRRREGSTSEETEQEKMHS